MIELVDKSAQANDAALLTPQQQVATDLNIIHDDNIIDDVSVALRSPPENLPGASITEYTTLLQQIPGFEPYEYPQTPSSSPGERKVADHLGSERPGSSHVAAASIAILDSTAKQRYSPLNAEELLPALPELRNIKHSRERLLQEQLKIESMEYDLGKNRVAISRDTKELARVLEARDMTEITLRARFDKILTRIQGSLKQMENMGQDLEVQQRLLTSAHTQFHRDVDGLYASLTGGAHMEDSEGTEEIVRADLAVADRQSSPLSLPDRDHETSIEPDAVREIASDKFSHKSDIPSFEQGKSFSAEKPHSDAEEQVSSGTGRKATTSPARSQSDKLTMLSSRKAWPGRIKRLPELASWGSHLPSDGLLQKIESAEYSPILLANRSLKLVRRKDLRPELMIDSVMRNANHGSTAKAKPVAIRRSIMQNFNDINAESFHRSDLLSLWGANMSQNSWTDFQRSILHDNPGPNEKRRSLFSSLPLLDATAMTSFLRELDIPSIQLRLKQSTLIAIAPSSAKRQFASVSAGDGSSLHVQCSGKQ